MEALWSLIVGLLAAGGIYLMLERHILRILFGLILFSNAVNLGIFTAGRLTRGAPPLVPQGGTALEAGYANPLPQALILTAIVIGFGLLIFALVLAYRAYKETNTADVDAMRLAEKHDA